jgi:bacterioferritin (cytochrome b1)
MGETRLKMKDSTRQILEILRKAVASERFFQQEYSRGATLAEEPEVKEVFLKLVEDEMQHERILTERYQMLKGEPLVLEPEEKPSLTPRWEHDISVHTMSEIETIRERLGLEAEGEPAVLCDAQGICFFDSKTDPNVEVLKAILNARGADGWRLVQVDYRRDRLICTWRRRRDD